MRNKKSYMDSNGLLNESFFRKLKRTLSKLTKKMRPKGSTERQVADNIRDFNKGVEGFEKAWEKLYGKKINLDRLTVNDFK